MALMNHTSPPVWICRLGARTTDCLCLQPTARTVELKSSLSLCFLFPPSLFIPKYRSPVMARRGFKYDVPALLDRKYFNVALLWCNVGTAVSGAIFELEENCGMCKAAFSASFLPRPRQSTEQGCALAARLVHGIFKIAFVALKSYDKERL